MDELSGMDELIGRGLPLKPLKTGRGALFDLLGGPAKIESAIEIILRTSPGRRVMRPTFGCRIHELAFAPASSETLGLAERYVAEALALWEPRVRVEQVKAWFGAGDNTTLWIEVRYRILDSYDVRSLVRPFYTPTGEPGRAPIASDSR
jgi:phage baseplate assembly protein W